MRVWNHSENEVEGGRNSLRFSKISSLGENISERQRGNDRALVQAGDVPHRISDRNWKKSASPQGKARKDFWTPAGDRSNATGGLDTSLIEDTFFRGDMKMKAKDSSYRTTPRRLRMEQLENRRLLAADAGFVGDYWLIEGTNGPDVIVVEQEGTTLRAWVNKVPQEADVFRYNGVAVQAKAGNDSIIIENSVMLPTRLHGGQGDDTIVGSRQNDVISGGVGNDDIYARAGNDEVWGDQMPIPEEPVLRPHDGDIKQVIRPPVEAPANDIIRGGYGDDTLHGGPGNDVLYGEVGPIENAEPLASQDPRFASEVERDVHAPGIYHDYIYGDEGEDELHGGPQRDFFAGGLHGDEIHAIDGYVDLIQGGPDDEFYADPNDIIIIWQPQTVPLQVRRDTAGDPSPVAENLSMPVMAGAHHRSDDCLQDVDRVFAAGATRGSVERPSVGGDLQSDDTGWDPWDLDWLLEDLI